MSKVFYPTNLGGMSINWVDYLGSTKNSTNKSELLIDHIATMSNENNGKDVYINFFKEIDRIDDETAENQYKTFLRINITEAIKHDLEWMEMNNKSINEYSDHGSQTLVMWGSSCCSCMCMRGRTHTSFVGEESSGNTVTDRFSYSNTSSTAEYGIWLK